VEVESNQSEILMKRSARGEFALAFFKQPSGAKNGIIALPSSWCGSAAQLRAGRRESVPLILFRRAAAYRHWRGCSLEDHKRPWHVRFVSPSFECLKSAAWKHGDYVLARALVAATATRGSSRLRLPQLPIVELAYSFGRRSNSRVSANSPTIWRTA